MKKLLLALLTVGALGTVAWLTRDRLLPPPTVSGDPPPRFRVAPTHVEDLEQISGIGPVYAGRLAEEGITSFVSLAGADAADLSERIDVAESMVSDWVLQAKDRSP